MAQLGANNISWAALTNFPPGDPFARLPLLLCSAPPPRRHEHANHHQRHASTTSLNTQPLPSPRLRSRTQTLISAASFRGYLSPSPLNLLHGIAADRTRRPTRQEQFRTLCARTNRSSSPSTFSSTANPFYVPYITAK